MLQTALSHFDAHGSGTIGAGELSATLESFKLPLPHDKAMRIAGKHAAGPQGSQVRYADFVRSLHANDPAGYHGASTLGHHEHAHHYSQPGVGPLESHYHMSKDLLQERPREHPARSAARYAAYHPPSAARAQAARAAAGRGG